ncbi:unnamed protein product, partial [Ixodes pacificus]
VVVEATTVVGPQSPRTRKGGDDGYGASRAVCTVNDLAENLQMPCTKPAVLRKSRSSVAPAQAAVRRTMLELMEARLRDVEGDIVASLETMRSDAQAICEKSTTYINEIILDFEHTGLLDKNFLEVMGEKESDIYAFMDSDSSSGCTVPSTSSF